VLLSPLLLVHKSSEVCIYGKRLYFYFVQIFVDSVLDQYNLAFINIFIDGCVSCHSVPTDCWYSDGFIAGVSPSSWPRWSISRPSLVQVQNVIHLFLASALPQYHVIYGALWNDKQPKVVLRLAHSLHPAIFQYQHINKYTRWVHSLMPGSKLLCSSTCCSNKCRTPF